MATDQSHSPDIPYASILTDAETYVKSLHANQLTEKLPFHHLGWIQEVVVYATQIAKHYEMSDQDYFILLCASWFRDTGYLVGESAKNKEKSVDLLFAFSQNRELSGDILDKIKSCMAKSHWPQTPSSQTESILCDAVYYFLGTDDFPEMIKQLRKEEETIKKHKIDKVQWRDKHIDFLKNYRFHTDYCQKLLKPGLAKNLEKLVRKAEKEQSLPVEIDTGDSAVTISTSGNKNGAMDTENAQASPAEVFVSQPRKKKEDRPDKGIETMFRISSGSQQRLSDMADNKANIMITTNSIILSVLLSVLLRQLEDSSYLVLPTVLLLTVCVTTMVFSILATRPSVPPGIFSAEDLDKRKVNLLFFGNFYKMSFESYAAGMQEMMNDRDFLYGTLTRDVYAQGVVLGKKYRLLRIAYNVFMFGIVASVIAFLISSIFFS